MNLYICGRLRDTTVRDVAELLREEGHDVFDDWHAAHPDADDKWREYEIRRGRSYADVVGGDSAFRECVRDFDFGYLNRADAIVIVGGLRTSTAIEMGYIQGRNSMAQLREQKIYWLLPDDPERWDFMTTGIIVRSVAELVEKLR